MSKKSKMVLWSLLLIIACTISFTSVNADGYFLKGFWDQDKDQGEKEVDGVTASMNDDYHAESAPVSKKAVFSMKVEGNLYDKINSLDYERTPKQPSLKGNEINKETLHAILTYIGSGSVVPPERMKNPETDLQKKQRITQLIKDISIDAIGGGSQPKGQYPEAEMKSQLETKFDHIEELLHLSDSEPLNNLARDAKNHFHKAIQENSVAEFYKGTSQMRALTQALY